MVFHNFLKMSQGLLASIVALNLLSGRTRLEPVAIVILSCIMASASVVMIRESIEGIISKKISVDLSAISISLVAGMTSFR